MKGQEGTEPNSTHIEVRKQNIDIDIDINGVKDLH
jgi:hypothetical protein